MADDEIEPVDNDQPLGPPKRAAAKKGRRSFSRVQLELNDEELANTAVQKLLIEDLNRQYDENDALRGYVDKFHGVDKQNCILTEKLRVRTGFDIMAGSLLTVGAALVGYGSTVTADQGPDILLIGFGIVLMIAAIVAKGLTR
ncbi:MAG: hypothetical protein V7664_08150 [Qipengyuania sp.]|uniref:hypothetical protein n=1 Tax=Qipengyuania sp. TaxID=2004515 RepID=UPI00300259F1